VLICLGWTAASLALVVGEALVLAPVLGGSRPGLLLVLLSTSLQVAVLTGVVAAWLHLTGLRARPAADVVLLGSRAERAEEELAREHELLHELRSTVAGIATSHRLLHDRGVDLPPERRGRLERLQGAEMARLERLLDSQAHLHTGPVGLDDIVQPLVETLRVHGHDIRWTGGGHLACASSDGVAGILHVLLENAVRHADGRGVEVSAERAGDEVLVRVRDHGPGVDPDVLPALFERGSRRRGSPGQGLGLGIAHRLAHQMGGRLELEATEPGRAGAAFALSLPAAAGALSCLELSG
jgi:signal transduction histidine kinase